MIDTYPYARATLKAHSFFTGFNDQAGRFKVFLDGETPSDETPFVTIDPGIVGQNQINDFAAQFITFTVFGTDQERGKLWTIARKIHEVFDQACEFAAVQSTFTAALNDVCTSPQHQLFAGDIVTVSSDGTLPAGLSAATPYYVINPTMDTFSLSLTEGGDAIDITSAGTGTHKVIREAIPYNLLGDAEYDTGQNPITEHVTVSVALRFGIVA